MIRAESSGVMKRLDERDSQVAVKAISRACAYEGSCSLLRWPTLTSEKQTRGCRGHRTLPSKAVQDSVRDRQLVCLFSVSAWRVFGKQKSVLRNSKFAMQRP